MIYVGFLDPFFQLNHLTSGLNFKRRILTGQIRLENSKRPNQYGRMTETAEL